LRQETYRKGEGSVTKRSGADSLNLKKIAANLQTKPVLYPGQLSRPNTHIGAKMYYRLAKLANPRTMSVRKPERWISPPARRLVV